MPVRRTLETVHGEQPDAVAWSPVAGNAPIPRWSRSSFSGTLNVYLNPHRAEFGAELQVFKFALVIHSQVINDGVVLDRLRLTAVVHTVPLAVLQ